MAANRQQPQLPPPPPGGGDEDEDDLEGVEDDIDEIVKMVKELKRKRKDERSKRREKKQELRNLRIQEGDLEVTLKTFQQWLAEANQGMGRRVEGIRRLNGRITEATMEMLGIGATGEVEPVGGGKKKWSTSMSACYSSKDEGEDAAGGMGRRDAVFIFPEEIWRIILGFLTSPDDLWNSSNTCQLFHDIVQKWRTRYLLEQALPHLYPLLMGKKLLECRLVCKSWATGVESFLGEHPSLRPYTPQDPRRLDFVNPMREKSLGGGNIYTFGDVGKGAGDSPRTFPDRQMALRRNPFIGRYVTMIIGKDDKAPKGTWERASQFLIDFGKDIHYLSLFFPTRPESDQVRKNMYVLLSRLPGMAPNLRKLRIDTANYANRMVGERGFVPFPKLETLESDFPERFRSNPMLETLARLHHSQLRKLFLNAPAWALVCHLNWPNLTELNLIVWVPEDLGSLYGVRMPNLRKLGLYIRRVAITFDNLLEALNALSTTTRLETLYLEGPFKEMRYGGLQRSRLYAPATLKTLQIKHFPSRLIPDYTFLLRCFPLVENLNLYAVQVGRKYGVRPLQSEVALMSKDSCKMYAVGLGVTGEEDEAVQVNKYAYDGRMYESNIWGLLPQLKVFSFQWDVYTRQGYEAYLLSDFDRVFKAVENGVSVS